MSWRLPHRDDPATWPKRRDDMAKATKVRTIEDITREARTLATNYEKGWALKTELDALVEKIDTARAILCDAGVE